MDGKNTRSRGVQNGSGERLALVLEEGEPPAQGGVTVVCHGFRNTKDSFTPRVVADHVVRSGRNVVRFDFSGNGDSGGTFEFGNYAKEVEDLRAVIECLRSEMGYSVDAIVGHSKGANVVLLYAVKYNDVPKVVNISGRFDMTRGVVERFGEVGMTKIKTEGRLEQADRMGKYFITNESLAERMRTDMSMARSIKAHVLTIHGDQDEVIPVEDAHKYHELGICSHQLKVVTGANHCFNKHAYELGEGVVGFLNESFADVDGGDFWTTMSNCDVA